jgi:hypothetical protein
MIMMMMMMVGGGEVRGWADSFVVATWLVETNI